jgi:F0F1-type ATP synthase assembly protein I
VYGLAVSIHATRYAGRVSDPIRPSPEERPESQPSRDRGNDEAARTYRVGWKFVGASWEFSSHVLAGLLLGWGIDWVFGTRPWGLVGGACGGLLVGCGQFIRRALKLNAELGPVRRPPGGWRDATPREEQADQPSDEAERRRDDERSGGRTGGGEER